MYETLSEAREVWHFDMLAPPDESDRKILDLTFTRYPTCHLLVTENPPCSSRSPGHLLNKHVNPALTSCCRLLVSLTIENPARAWLLLMP